MEEARSIEDITLVMASKHQYVLPIETWLDIISQISHKDIAALSLASRQFRAIVLPRLFTELYLDSRKLEMQSWSTSKGIASLIVALSHARKLHWRGWQHLTYQKTTIESKHSTAFYIFCRDIIGHKAPEKLTVIQLVNEAVCVRTEAILLTLPSLTTLWIDEETAWLSCTVPAHYTKIKGLSFRSWSGLGLELVERCAESLTVLELIMLPVKLLEPLQKIVFPRLRSFNCYAESTTAIIAIIENSSNLDTISARSPNESGVVPFGLKHTNIHSLEANERVVEAFLLGRLHSEPSESATCTQSRLLDLTVEMGFGTFTAVLGQIQTSNSRETIRSLTIIFLSSFDLESNLPIEELINLPRFLFPSLTSIRVQLDLEVEYDGTVLSSMSTKAHCIAWAAAVAQHSASFPELQEITMFCGSSVDSDWTRFTKTPMSRFVFMIKDGGDWTTRG